MAFTLTDMDRQFAFEVPARIGHKRASLVVKCEKAAVIRLAWGLPGRCGSPDDNKKRA